MEQKRNLPKPVELFELKKSVELIAKEVWNQKSLFENIVNPLTAKQFLDSGDNLFQLKEIINNHELFEPNNFGKLMAEVNKLAERNKTIQNVDYSIRTDLNPDPYSDNYQTLSMEGWKKHILNLVYCIRADFTSFTGFNNRYSKWLEVYRLYCSGNDLDGLMGDLYNAGI